MGAPMGPGEPTERTAAAANAGSPALPNIAGCRSVADPHRLTCAERQIGREGRAMMSAGDPSRMGHRSSILYGFRPARAPGSAQSRRVRWQVRWQHLACECHLTNLRRPPLRNGGCPAGTRSLASAREYVNVYTGRGSRTVVTSEATLSHALASFGSALRPRSLATRRRAFSGSPQYARLP